MINLARHRGQLGKKGVSRLGGIGQLHKGMVAQPQGGQAGGFLRIRWVEPDEVGEYDLAHRCIAVVVHPALHRDGPAVGQGGIGHHRRHAPLQLGQLGHGEELAQRGIPYGQNPPVEAEFGLLRAQSARIDPHQLVPQILGWQGHVKRAASPGDKLMAGMLQAAKDPVLFVKAQGRIIERKGFQCLTILSRGIAAPLIRILTKLMDVLRI